MNHNRFFVNSSQISQTHSYITDSDNLHHIRVIRLRIDDEIIVLDGRGNEYCARISSMDSKQIIAEIVGRKSYFPLPLQMTLVQSIPKSDKINLIVEKCTELGVSQIVLTETNRSVKQQVNLPRLQRIAVSASSQSGRVFLPVVEEARFCDALGMVRQEAGGSQDFAGECSIQNLPTTDCLLRVGVNPTPTANVLGLMLWENAEKGMGEVLRTFIRTIVSTKDTASTVSTRVVLFVGPEGGFSQEEADEAARMGIIPVSLGKQILRTETAGLAGLTIVAYELGLLGHPSNFLDKS